MKQAPAIPSGGTANPSRVTLTELDETYGSALFARARRTAPSTIGQMTAVVGNRRRRLSIADLAAA